VREVAIRYACDRCGRRLEADDPNRFVVKIEVFAAADPLTITDEDLARDHRGEIARLVRQLDRMTPDDVEDQTYRAFRYDLCPACHKAYLAAPLGPAPTPGADPPEQEAGR
jgi:hypothetical protein